MKTGFSTAFDQFLRFHRDSWRPTTHYNWTSFFLGVFGPYFRERPLSKIGPQDISTMLEQRQIRASSRRTYIQILRRFWTWAEAEGLATGNPARRVPVKAARSRRMLPLSVAEAQCAIDSVEGRDRAIIATMLLTGLRRANIIALRPEHVADGLIQIPGELMKNGEDFIVPYHKQLDGILKRLPFGLGRHGIYALCCRVQRRTGITRLHPHLCRHTFGSWVARSAPESVVAKLLGHHREGSSITALYIHVDLEQMREALEQLPVLITA